MADQPDFRTTLRTTKVLQGPFNPLTITSLPNTPHAAFKKWYAEALATGIREPHAMTVSTVDEEGFPDARVLILKDLDARGWHFAIKADSPKGRQLAHNPRAALTFYWADMARQIRLRGSAVCLSGGECARDYLERPVESRVSAAASRQSEVLGNGAELEGRLAEMRGAFKGDSSVGVEGWRVYAVDPEVVEFWQGEASRLDMLEFVGREREIGRRRCFGRREILE
jgi:pyridoxamine 5'-phosphate oxidase